MGKLNINDHYAELLKNKDLTIPTEKSWKLIRKRNQGREENSDNNVVTCPNCGAPNIFKYGESECEYCGSPL